MKLPKIKLDKPTLTKIGKSVAKTVSKNRANIATVAACTGVVIAVVESSKAAIPANMDLEDAKTAKGSELTLWEKTKVVAPHYIKTAAATAVAISGSVYSRVTDAKEIKELTGTVTTLYEGFRAYKDAVKEETSKGKEAKITQKAAEKQTNESPIVMNDIILTGKGTDVGVDSYFTDRKFFTSFETLRAAENDLNEEIENEGFASLNFFYSRIGLPETGIGEEIGWDHKVDFVKYLPSTWVDVPGLGRRTAIDLAIPVDDLPRYGYYI